MSENDGGDSHYLYFGPWPAGLDRDPGLQLGLVNYPLSKATWSEDRMGVVGVLGELVVR